ncbi:MAG TPA: excinuclease ABC subunit UvrC [Bacteroidia bacterium]|nr:excinuclease ABC subunit UvrC [Bacteroidia bacterium]
MTDIDNHLDLILKSLPENPGVYQYFDKNKKIIYVGKAKNLKKRVASYFNKDKHENGKTAVLVRKIFDIKYIIVETELDALLLENNLIKKYQPRYNILLKDDKTYPWICIKKEPFPKIFSTRNIVKDGSSYFGPYASVKLMNTILDLVRQLYTVRNCNLLLSEENIRKKKFKVCLEFHLGNCKGPCEGLETEEEYNQSIREIKEIVRGNIHSVTRQLKQMMQDYANQFQFEKAQLLKEKIEILENYQSKSTIVTPDINNVDVFSIVTDEKSGYVNFLKVLNGAIIQGHTIELKKKLDEAPEELLSFAITELRQRFESDAKEIIVPFFIEMEIPGTTFFIPQRGDKKKLLELSERNVKQYRYEKIRKEELLNPEARYTRILEQMKKDLRLTELPIHIECFDNSNIQGAFPVAAMTVFKNTKPSKKNYRHFNIKTVEGPNDFASMEEIIFRRYKRAVEEKELLPQLIVIDGGKGQLSAAVKSLKKLNLMGKVGIISIAKKLEEIYYPGDSLPLYLDKKSETLRIIQQIRDEAHRFGITHHRSKREKKLVQSELTKIKGISDKTAEKLLRELKSVNNIKETSEAALAEFIGVSKAKLIFNYFNSIV